MRVILVLLLAVVACTPKSGKIELPDLSAEFYRQALDDVSERYRNHPNRDLLLQKLYYQEKLDWPQEAIIDLYEAEKQFGLTKKIIQNYCDYYYKNGRYFELLKAVSVARSLEKPDATILKYEIIGHVHVSPSDVAHSYLNRYLTLFNSSDDLEFGVNQFLEMKDTLMAVYYLNKLQKVDPGNTLITELLVPALLKFGYTDRAKKNLNEYLAVRPQAGLDIAAIMIQLGDFNSAKRIYRQMDTKESNLLLADRFSQERLYDSSVFYIDKVLAVDSSSQFLIRKGEILEARGWLTSAYFLYQFVVDASPEDSVALARSVNVGRKIAYLRRIKEEQELAPILKLEPKDLTE